MPLELTALQAGRLRMRGQRLAPASAAAGVGDAARSVLGLQAQSWQAAVMSVRPRTPGATAEDVETARVRDRSVVRTWAMRGTLFLLAAEDLRPFIALLGPGQIAATRSRYAGLGLDEDRLEAGMRVIREALTNGGPLSRAQIGEGLVRSGVLPDTRGQAMPHLLRHAALAGVICHGPYRAGAETYVLVDDWLGDAGRLRAAAPREAILLDLARRYLGAFAPATERDFATWSGLRMGDARGVWASLAGELAEVTVDGRMSWMLRERLRGLEELDTSPVATRLVPSFDTYLLGYASREHMLPEAWSAWVWSGGGIIHPTVVEDGDVVGAWTVTTPKHGRTTVTIEPFGRWRRDRVARALAEAEDVGRFLGSEADVEFGG